MPRVCAGPSDGQTEPAAARKDLREPPQAFADLPRATRLDGAVRFQEKDEDGSLPALVVGADCDVRNAVPVQIPDPRGAATEFCRADECPRESTESGGDLLRLRRDRPDLHQERVPLEEQDPHGPRAVAVRADCDVVDAVAVEVTDRRDRDPEARVRGQRDAGDAVVDDELIEDRHARSHGVEQDDPDRADRARPPAVRTDDEVRRSVSVDVAGAGDPDSEELPESQRAPHPRREIADLEMVDHGPRAIRIHEQDPDRAQIVVGDAAVVVGDRSDCEVVHPVAVEVANRRDREPEPVIRIEYAGEPAETFSDLLRRADDRILEDHGVGRVRDQASEAEQNRNLVNGSRKHVSSVEAARRTFAMLTGDFAFDVGNLTHDSTYQGPALAESEAFMGPMLLRRKRQDAALARGAYRQNNIFLCDDGWLPALVAGRAVGSWLKPGTARARHSRLVWRRDGQTNRPVGEVQSCSRGCGCTAQRQQVTTIGDSRSVE